MQHLFGSIASSKKIYVGFGLEGLEFREDLGVEYHYFHRTIKVIVLVKAVFVITAIETYQNSQY